MLTRNVLEYSPFNTVKCQNKVYEHNATFYCFQITELQNVIRDAQSELSSI